MTALHAWLALSGLLAIGGIAWAGVEHDRTQQARLEALTRELREARGEVAALRASEASTPPAPVIIGGPPAAVDMRVADAIAARVLSASDARAKAAAAIAADESAPTDRQLDARAAATHKLDDAIARGHLTRDDMLAVRQKLADDPLGRAEFRRQLAVAINQRKIVPDDPRVLAP